MIKMIEKKIVTNHNPRELSILKKQLTQFQLYDLLIEYNGKNAFNLINNFEKPKNNTKEYAKHLSYK